MLKIQEFIKANPNWRIKLSEAPFNLKISEEDGFVLFKYNQISSDFNEEICREARGLILDSTDNFKVVRFAFRKFFNLDESYADKIDWSNCAASEKIDGSIMTLWFARGEWHLSTNGCIDAYKAELGGVGPYKTFGELFEVAAQNSNLDYSKLWIQRNYTFELVSPFNQIVLQYERPELYHLSTRRMTDLSEVEQDIGVKKPVTYKLNTERDYRLLVEKMEEGHEGIVVKDSNGNRVKIKTLLYFQLHRMVNNGNLTLERTIDLIRTNETSEFLSYFPQFKFYFEDVAAALTRIDHAVFAANSITQFYKEKFTSLYSERNAKKEFAKIYSTSPIKHLYFAAWDNKLNSKIDSMSTDQFVSYFRGFLGGL